MITATEPLEYFPRGRQVVDYHPGPTVDEEVPHGALSVDFALLHRLESVSISIDEDDPEFFRLREVPIPVEGPEKPLPHLWSAQYICTEEELYVRGNTAVWTRCISSSSNVPPQTSFNCDSPIRFAFFCPEQFVRPDTAGPDELATDRNAVCLIDDDTLHVYCDNGDTYRAMVKCPVAAVWKVPCGIMLERKLSQEPQLPSSCVPWPRLFTLTYPLEEMKPILMSNDSCVGYFDDMHYRVVFSSDQVSLVLLYGEVIRKHFVCRLRRATEEELAAMQLQNDSSEESGSVDLDDQSTDDDLEPSASSARPAIGTKSWAGTSGNGTESRMPFFRHPVDPSTPYEHKTTLEEPLNMSDTPQYCLEHVWTYDTNTVIGPDGSSIPLWSAVVGEMASTAFLHTDLVGNRYLCFLQSKAARLTLVQFNDADLSIVGSRTVPARSAIALDRLNMIVLVDTTGNLVLYSGPTAVGKLHVAGLLNGGFRTPTVGLRPPAKPSKMAIPRRSTLLPNVATPESGLDDELHLLSPVRANVTTYVLRDATGSRFSLALANRRTYRIALAPVATAPLVRDCLTVLYRVLPRIISHDFLVRWYGTRNVPGSVSGFSTHREWTFFRGLFFTALGRPVAPPPPEPDVEEPTGTDTEGRPSDPAEEPKKRRRREGSDGHPDDWEFLMRQAIGREGPAEGSAGTRPYHPVDTGSLFPFIPDLLPVLHLLYEDLKLDVTRGYELRLLGDTLYCLAGDAQLPAYQLHYFTDWPGLVDRYRKHGPCHITDPAVIARLPANVAPPGLFRHVERLVSGDEGVAPFPHHQHVNDLTADIVTLVAHIYQAPDTDGWIRRRLESVLSEDFFAKQAVERFSRLREPRSDPDVMEVDVEDAPPPDPEPETAFELIGDTVLAFLTKRGHTRDRLARLPVALRFVLFQCLESCRNMLTHGHPAAYYRLLMRPELLTHSVASGLKHWIPAGMAQEDGEDASVRSISQGNAINRWQTDMSDIEVGVVLGGTSGTAAPSAAPTATGGSGTGTGAATGTGTGAGTGTTSSAPAKEDVSHRSDNPDDDGMADLDDEVLQLLFPDDRRIEDVRKFLNSAAGARIHAVQSPALMDHEFQEEQERRLYAICIRTMALPVGRGMFTVCSNFPRPTQPLPVPRMCLTGRDMIRGTTIELQQIELPANMSAWPAFHNGVAAGLRIAPDSPHLTSSWITHNRNGGAGRATSGPDASIEHGGFLLALGLTGHLQALSLYSTFDYMVRSDEMVRLGLLLGKAAAHRGTGDLTTTRLLAVHVEALLPPTAVELDVSQNLQVAALLGVGLLYQGTGKRHIAEVLLHEIGRPPGPEMENYVERESYALTAGLALGLVTLGCGNRASALQDLAVPDMLYYYMNGGCRRPMVGAQKDKYRMSSFQIREGGTVNVDVTAPGATLALGLMYFDTGNEAIASWMQPPNTNFLLKYVRPDLLLFRTIARHLIHWDGVRSDREWFDAQVPPLIRKKLEIVMDQGPWAEQGETWMDMRKADRQLYCQAFCSITIGTAMAVGLRYAGTANAEAVATLRHFMRFFNCIGELLNDPSGTHMEPMHAYKRVGVYVGSQAIENCTIMALLAMSMVLAGTGDLVVLRAVRFLRSRIGKAHVTYGSHMAIHMALGFLFLGGGRFTLSRSPGAIAALLCSIFPKFPIHSNDNRYHLQAFRHLYVLAIEPRIFLPRSIDTGKVCLCRIRYALRDRPDQPVERFAPCLLPELNTLLWVEMADENFWGFRFERRNWSILERILKKCGRFDVKQHIGRLSYQEDPTRLITSQIMSLAARHHIRWKFNPLDLLKLAAQPTVINITEKLLVLPNTKSLRWQREPRGSSGYERYVIGLCARQVVDCVMNDRMHALPTFLDLTKMFLIDPEQLYHSDHAWQVRLLTAILPHHVTEQEEEDSLMLMSIQLLQALVQNYWKRSDDQRLRYGSLIRQFLGWTVAPRSRDCSLTEVLSELHLPEAGQGSASTDLEQRRRHLGILTQLSVMYDLPYRLLETEWWHRLWVGKFCSSRTEFMCRLTRANPEMSCTTIACIADAIRNQ